MLGHMGVPEYSCKSPRNHKPGKLYSVQARITSTAVKLDFPGINLLCRPDNATFLEQKGITSSVLHPSKAWTFTKTATAFDASDPAASKSVVSEPPHVPPPPFAAAWSITMLVDRTIAAPAVEAQTHQRSTKYTRNKKGAREEEEGDTEGAQRRPERSTKETRKDHQRAPRGFVITSYSAYSTVGTPPMLRDVTLIGYDTACLKMPMPCH